MSLAQVAASVDWYDNKPVISACYACAIAQSLNHYVIIFADNAADIHMNGHLGRAASRRRGQYRDDLAGPGVAREQRAD